MYELYGSSNPHDSCFSEALFLPAAKPSDLRKVRVVVVVVGGEGLVSTSPVILFPIMSSFSLKSHPDCYLPTHNFLRGGIHHDHQSLI